MKFITPIIIIVISVGMYILYIGPAFANISALSAQKTSYDSVLLQSKQLISERDAILTKYDSIPSSDIDKLNEIIPATFDPVLFANTLNGIALRDGVAIGGIKLSQTPADSTSEVAAAPNTNPYVTSIVDLTMTGPYPQFVQFLKDVESSLQLIDVASLSITPPQQAAPSAQGQSASSQAPAAPIQYTLELDTYSLK